MSFKASKASPSLLPPLSSALPLPFYLLFLSPADQDIGITSLAISPAPCSHVCPHIPDHDGTWKRTNILKLQASLQLHVFLYKDCCGHEVSSQYRTMLKTGPKWYFVSIKSAVFTMSNNEEIEADVLMLSQKVRSCKLELHLTRGKIRPNILIMIIIRKNYENINLTRDGIGI